MDQQRQVQLTVGPEEANFIINVLSELPTKTGAYPLVMKLQQQIAAQVSGSDGRG